MATVNIVRFSKPNLLKKIDPSLFLEFARAHSAFFEREGVEIAHDSDPEGIPYDAIAASFMRLDPDADKALIDALYYLDSLSSDAGADIVLEQAEAAGIPLPGERLHPVDLSLRVWLSPGGPELLERIQDRQEVKRFRSFQFFGPGEGKEGTCSAPPPDRLREAEAEMKPVFEKRKRGDDCRIAMFEEEDETWFVIRHGEILNRGESVKEGGETGIVVFRPVAHDVVIYGRERRELRTNVRAGWLLDLYRKVFGRMLFGDDAFFTGDPKYTLDPLRESGADALACAGIDGIEEIKLKELEVMYSSGGGREYVRHRGTDLFGQWAAAGRHFPGGAIIQASFSVRFPDSDNPRTVSIRGSNRLIVSRDHDGPPVERWLEAKKFIREREGEDE